MPDLQGGVITADALHLHDETMNQVVEDKNGHMLIGLKGNREKLLNEVKAAFEAATGKVVRRDVDTDFGHGRIEIRTVEIIPLQTKTKYKHVSCAIRVERTRTQKKSGNTSRETSYYVGTFTADHFTPSEVQALVRGHWAIENRLHHSKDRTMKEDRCRARSYTGSNLALLRSIVTLMKHQERGRNKGIAGALKANSDLGIEMILRTWADAC